jgi:hypothetical protein
MQIAILSNWNQAGPGFNPQRTSVGKVSWLMYSLRMSLNPAASK